MHEQKNLFPSAKLISHVLIDFLVKQKWIHLLNMLKKQAQIFMRI